MGQERWASATEVEYWKTRPIRGDVVVTLGRGQNVSHICIREALIHRLKGKKFIQDLSFCTGNHVGSLAGKGELKQKFLW